VVQAASGSAAAAMSEKTALFIFVLHRNAIRQAAALPSGERTGLPTP